MALLVLLLVAAACGSDVVQAAPVVEAPATATAVPSTPAPVPTAVPVQPAAVVMADETYEVAVSTHVFAEGLSHTDWGSEEAVAVDLELDLYEPVDAPGNRPAIVMVHGGGFRSGTRFGGTFVGFGEYFATRGWVAISVDYRLQDQHGTVPAEWMDWIEGNVETANQDQALALYPAARDTKAAIRWLYANADTYGVNTGHIAAMGGSAGAALAIMAGVTDEADYRDELTVEQDLTLDSTNLDQPSRVAAVVDYWGPPVLVTALEQVYGFERFDAADAPMAIVHGTRDPTVDFGEAQTLRDAFLATGVEHEFYPLDGAGHGPWNATVNGRTLREVAFDFIVGVLGLTVS